MSYVVKTTETFEKEFYKNHRDKARQLEKIIEKLENEPWVGKPLRGSLHGIWQFRMGSFRIWYEINEKEKMVILRAVLHKNKAKEYY